METEPDDILNNLPAEYGLQVVQGNMLKSLMESPDCLFVTGMSLVAYSTVYAVFSFVVLGAHVALLCNAAYSPFYPNIHFQA